MSSADRAAAWWQWALSLSATGHPLLDGPCEQWQSGHVWYLGGTFGSGTVERACEIPSGTALFFPVRNTVYIAFEGDPDTDQEIAEQAQGSFTELGVEVDGVPIDGLDQHRVESPLFFVEEPVFLNDLFGLDERNVRAVTTGIYLHVPPLSVGEHILTFRGALDGELLDVTYHLSVVPRGQYKKAN